MKSYEINSNSWHYKLVKLADPMITYEEESDLCSYTRKVLAGLFVVILLSSLTIAVGGSLLYLLGDTIGYVVAGLVLGEFAPFDGPPVVAAILTTSVLSTWIFYKSLRFYINLHNKRKLRSQQEGFVSKAYKSWKEKTCSKITFKSESN